MFMQLAIGAIGISIVLFIGYLFIAQARTLLPDESELPENFTRDGIDAVQPTVLVGFGLIGIGVLVLAAFGIVTIFR